jgi:hypothetical protein
MNLKNFLLLSMVLFSTNCVFSAAEFEQDGDVEQKQTVIEPYTVGVDDCDGKWRLYKAHLYAKYEKKEINQAGRVWWTRIPLFEWDIYGGGRVTLYANIIEGLNLSPTALKIKSSAQEQVVNWLANRLAVIKLPITIQLNERIAPLDSFELASPIMPGNNNTHNKRSNKMR